METDTELRWFALYTYAGHEKKVEALLKERIEAMKLHDKITEIYIPVREKIVISEGKKRTVEERLFPGYVLVKMALSDQTWHAVRNTQGVTSFVGTEGRPTPLNEQEVNAVLKWGELQAPKLELRYQVGDHVRITDGPFSDMSGSVQKIDENKGKITVLVNIFGRETPVELDFLQVGTL